MRKAAPVVVVALALVEALVEVAARAVVVALVPVVPAAEPVPVAPVAPVVGVGAVEVEVEEPTPQSC
jgi:hypothetical protein